MKVALVFICVNSNYWPFFKDVVEDAKKNFLPGHHVDFLGWSDLPELDSPEHKAVLAQHAAKADIQASLLKIQQESEAHPENREALNDQYIAVSRYLDRETIDETIRYIRGEPRIKIFPAEPAVWPMGTLFRYHLFLQEEELLKKYDYVFYLDVDMRIVGTIGDDIMGDGLTMAQHPMYALARRFIPPYEPNPQSAAYVPRFGRVYADEDGKKHFEPLYAAGGFQGGRTADFIAAMKEMKKSIDADFVKNYIAIWNDESHWNYYLSQHPPAVALSPSYIYPDSLIEEYYVPLWGCRYEPKIITLTKKFSLSKGAGAQLRDTLSQMKALK